MSPLCEVIDVVDLHKSSLVINTVLWATHNSIQGKGSNLFLHFFFTFSSITDILQGKSPNDATGTGGGSQTAPGVKLLPGWPSGKTWSAVSNECDLCRENKQEFAKIACWFFFLLSLFTKIEFGSFLFTRVDMNCRVRWGLWLGEN